MKTNGIIGREYEQELIKNYYESNKAELVALDCQPGDILEYKE